MKKMALVFILLMLCGCTHSKVHTCQMTSDDLNWEIQYETDDSGHVVLIQQSVSVEVENQEQKDTYQTMFDEMFNDYIKNYEGACSLEKYDLDTMVKRTLVIKYDQLTEKQKDEMSFESAEEYLIAQLDYAGYTCD